MDKKNKFDELSLLEHKIIWSIFYSMVAGYIIAILLS